MKAHRIIGFIMMLLLFSGTATALGVAPAEKEIDFNPGTSENFELVVINNDGLARNVTLSVDGPISEYVNVSRNSLELEEGEREERVTVTIEMPEELDSGPHPGRILVQERGEGSGTVSALVTVVSRLTLFAPYEGQHLRISLIRTDFERGEEGEFLLEAENVGTEPVGSAKTTFNVLERDETLKVLESDSRNVPERGSTFFRAPWKPTLREGLYSVEAVVDYGNKSEAVERNFKIGTQELKINGIDVTEFDLGEEVRLNLRVENAWNRPLDEAFAEIEMRNEGRSYGGSPTPVESFEAYEEKNLTAEWDSSGAPTGNYTVVVTLNYLGKSVEKTYPAVLAEDGLFIKGIPSRIIAPEEPSLAFYAVIGILVLMIAILVIYHARKEYY